MKWIIQIPNFQGGLAPGYWLSDYPGIGNANMAGKMQNIDLTNPKIMTAGADLTVLANGNESGVVNELIKGIIDYAVDKDTTFGISATKLFKIGANGVYNGGGFPHTITDAVSGQDTAYYNEAIYYSYNKSQSGDIGEYNTKTHRFNDDWGTTIPTGKKGLQRDVPHPLLAAGNGRLYIGNKNYVSFYNGTIFVEKDLDLPKDCVVQDLVWYLNKVFVATNRPDVSGDNKNIASLYVWDGYSDTWDDEFTIKGRITALHIRNNRLYVFWEDLTAGQRLSLMDMTEGALRDLAIYSGSSPLFYQVTDYKNHIIWVSDDDIFAFGTIDDNLAGKFFQLASAGYSTGGGIASPFSAPIVASTNDTNYQIAKFKDYDTDSFWKSLLIDVTGERGEGESTIEKVILNFETLELGARADVTLKDESGNSVGDTIVVSYVNEGAVHQKIKQVGATCDNFRVEIDNSNGSSTKPVKFKSITIVGNTTEK